MKAWIGKSLVAIGIVHNIGGIIIYQSILGILVGERIYNTVTIFEGYDRQAAFWFLFAGFMLMIVGGLVSWFENQDKVMPKFIEWSMAGVTITGIVVMPRAGFWLLILPTIGLFYRRKRKVRNE